MWIFVGLAIVAIYIAMALWLKNRKISLTWYELLLGVVGLALLLFSLQNFFASAAELEPIAPGMFLLVFGIPSAILLFVAFLLPFWRYFRSRRAKTVNVQ